MATLQQLSMSQWAWPGADAWRGILDDAWADGVVLGAIVYVLFQPLLRLLVSVDSYERNKNAWKWLMVSYNVLMSIYSGATFFFGAKYLSRATGLFTTTVRDFATPDFMLVAKVFWLSKYVEYIDTAFLVISGKPVSILQYFHHIGASVVMWITWRYFSPQVWLFVMWNSFIHTLMYAYYAASARGIRLPFKWIMTFLQILQLVTGLLMSFWFPINQAGFNSSEQLMASAIVGTVYMLVLTSLFFNFFFTTYIWGASNKKHKKH